ncbi:hypothetical protein ACFQ9X_39720 [Catenulispora yoronensis]
MTSDLGFFDIDLRTVGLVVSEVESVVGAGNGVVGEVGSLLLGSSDFAQIGALVSGADNQLHSTLMDVLTRGMQFFDGLNGAVQCCVDDYASLDSLVSDSFGGKTTPAVPPAAATRRR